MSNLNKIHIFPSEDSYNTNIAEVGSNDIAMLPIPSILDVDITGKAAVADLSFTANTATSAQEALHTKNADGLTVARTFTIPKNILNTTATADAVLLFNGTSDVSFGCNGCTSCTSCTGTCTGSCTSCTGCTSCSSCTGSCSNRCTCGGGSKCFIKGSVKTKRGIISIQELSLSDEICDIFGDFYKIHYLSSGLVTDKDIVILNEEVEFTDDHIFMENGNPVAYNINNSMFYNNIYNNNILIGKYAIPAYHKALGSYTTRKPNNDIEYQIVVDSPSPVWVYMSDVMVQLAIKV